MVGVVVHAVAAIIGAGAIAIAVSTSMQGTLSSGRRIRVVANDCWPLTPELIAIDHHRCCSRRREPRNKAMRPEQACHT